MWNKPLTILIYHKNKAYQMDSKVRTGWSPIQHDPGPKKLSQEYLYAKLLTLVDV